MKNIDLSPLIILDNEYGRLKDSVTDSFKGNWDDKIHDSYQRYVMQIQKYSQDVHAIRCKTESLKKEIEALDVDGLLKQADELCREADSI